MTGSRFIFQLVAALSVPYVGFNLGQVDRAGPALCNGPKQSIALQAITRGLTDKVFWVVLLHGAGAGCLCLDRRREGLER